MGEMDHVGRGLAPAVTKLKKQCLRVVEGADPYECEIFPIPYMVTEMRAFKNVGDGALDVP